MTPTTLYRTTVAHHRETPLRHTFAYHSTAWLVDLDALGGHRRPADLPWWLRLFVSFDARDHLGDPEQTWRDNVTSFAATAGVDLRGGSVVAVTTPRSLGHAFNPLTVYWCRATSGDRCVVAEVQNTYGERHCYLLRPDDHDVATAEKALYVSPFNDDRGQYTLAVPLPGHRLDVTATLHRDGARPFVATWRGRRVSSARDLLAAALPAAVTPLQTTVRIHRQGIALWLRHLPVIPRPHHVRQEAV